MVLALVDCRNCNGERLVAGQKAIQTGMVLPAAWRSPLGVRGVSPRLAYRRGFLLPRTKRTRLPERRHMRSMQTSLFPSLAGDHVCRLDDAASQPVGGVRADADEPSVVMPAACCVAKA